MKNPRGHLLWLLLSLAILSLTACRNDGEQLQSGETTSDSAPTISAVAGPVDPELVSTAWRLTELNGVSFPTHIVTTLIFNSNQVSGYTGCNKWQSVEDIAVTDGVFSLPSIATETGGCAYPELEDEFQVALTISATAYHREGTHLFIKGEDDRNVLVFTNERSTEPHTPLPPMTTEQTAAGIFFTHTLEPWSSEATTIAGQFVEVDNCLRLALGDRDNPLLIWPHDVKLVEEDGQLEIVDLNDKTLARLGNTLELTGVHLFPPDNWRGLIPDECHGPYFVVDTG